MTALFMRSRYAVSLSCLSLLLFEIWPRAHIRTRSDAQRRFLIRMRFNANQIEREERLVLLLARRKIQFGLDCLFRFVLLFRLLAVFGATMCVYLYLLDGVYILLCFAFAAML